VAPRWRTRGEGFGALVREGCGGEPAGGVMRATFAAARAEGSNFEH